VDVAVILDDRELQEELLGELAAAGFDVDPRALEDLNDPQICSTAFLAGLPDGSRLMIELIRGEPALRRLTVKIIGRAKTMPYPGRPSGMNIVTPEDLVLDKVFLFRDGSGSPYETDDRKDIARVLAVQKNLDVDYVRREMVDLPKTREELAKRSRWFEKALRKSGLLP
jgi:hypothetical protein